MGTSRQEVLTNSLNLSLLFFSHGIMFSHTTNQYQSFFSASRTGLVVRMKHYSNVEK